MTNIKMNQLLFINLLKHYLRKEKKNNKDINYIHQISFKCYTNYEDYYKWELTLYSNGYYKYRRKYVDVTDIVWSDHYDSDCTEHCGVWQWD